MHPLGGMNMHKLKNENGFTLAELLVVVAIIGILVAISIPVFTAQRSKAIIATNRANIRAARAAALSEIYNENGVAWDSWGKSIYLEYDIKTAQLSNFTWSGTNPDAGDGPNATGRKYREEAAKPAVCEKIIIYLDLTQRDEENMIQTAPYYTDDGELGSVKGNNPFGPGAGNYWNNK